jgi:hypothetical protein
MVHNGVCAIILGGSHNEEGAMSNAQFKLEEQSVVSTWMNQCSIANVPLSRNVDWFHNIVAIGGFLQYQFKHLSTFCSNSKSLESHLPQ